MSDKVYTVQDYKSGQPRWCPGIIDGKLVVMNPQKYEGVLMNNNLTFSD